MNLNSTLRISHESHSCRPTPSCSAHWSKLARGTTSELGRVTNALISFPFPRGKLLSRQRGAARAGQGWAKLASSWPAAPGSGGGPRAPGRRGCKSGARIPAAPQRQERLAEARLREEVAAVATLTHLGGAVPAGRAGERQQVTAGGTGRPGPRQAAAPGSGGSGEGSRAR